MKNLWISVKITLAMCLLLGVGYVLVLRGVSALAGPNGGQAETLTLDGRVVGAANVGQQFTGGRYFWGRPSAVDYNGGGSGGSIWLTRIRYRTSATSVTRADGGANNNNESGGGGGRICIANGLRASQIAELYTTGAASGRHTVVDLADPEVVVGDYVQFTISAAAPMRVACRFLSIRGSRHGVSRSGAGSEKRL